MSLELKISLLVLLAAFLHACWNALVKAGQDPLLTVTLVSGVAMLVSAALLPFVPVPATASWPYVFWGVVTHNGFKVFLLLAYRSGDLSRVYPLARGSAPLLVALLSVAVAGEELSGGVLAGVGLVSLGLASLALERPAAKSGAAGRPSNIWRSEGAAVVYALLTGAFIAAYTVIDGLGVRLSGDYLGYAAWLFFFDGMPMVALAVVARGRHLRTVLNRGMATGVAAGSLSLLAYFVVIWALSVGAMAPIAALRETGVIFAVLIGRLVLRERLGGRRLLAALLVGAGVALINLSH